MQSSYSSVPSLLSSRSLVSLGLATALGRLRSARADCVEPPPPCLGHQPRPEPSQGQLNPMRLTLHLMRPNPASGQATSALSFFLSPQADSPSCRYQSSNHASAPSLFGHSSELPCRSCSSSYHQLHPTRLQSLLQLGLRRNDSHVVSNLHPSCRRVSISR